MITMVSGKASRCLMSWQALYSQLVVPKACLNIHMLMCGCMPGDVRLDETEGVVLLCYPGLLSIR